MKGVNELNICTAQMVEMVQHYVDTVLFQTGQAPKVKDVKVINQGYAPTFIITLESRDEAAQQ